MSLEHHSDTASPLYPITWVCREDMLHGDSEHAAEIKALDEAEIEYLAECFGDALHNFYWATLYEVLSNYFSEKS